MVVASQRPAGVRGKKCTSCGGPADKFSSGELECWACWNWRKIDGPAARYWVKAIDGLFEDPESGSRGPDLIDIAKWTDWGVLDKVGDALVALKDLRTRYQAEIARAEERSR
jgi:hypothetical protein